MTSLVKHTHTQSRKASGLVGSIDRGNTLCSGDLKNSDLFQYGEESMHAWMEGRLSDDIMAEQRKVEEAELIIFQVRGHRGRSCGSD